MSIMAPSRWPLVSCLSARLPAVSVIPPTLEVMQSKPLLCVRVSFSIAELMNLCHAAVYRLDLRSGPPWLAMMMYRRSGRICTTVDLLARTFAR
ncbi:hypothetical protein JOE39_003681 [Pseudomonas sp. PvP100]|nr:hypothetical protein [Pseudomonas sp. PvP007]MBP1195702.1 hypothetical protein [Pseudomonas sp. PvP100]